MKISQLAQISRIRRNIRIPLAIEGENMSVTMGQILDSVSLSIVPFDSIRKTTQNIMYAPGSPTLTEGIVIFDDVSKKFYLAQSSTVDLAGMQVTRWNYFSDWAGHDDYYDEDGDVRKSCLFRDKNGSLYFYDGTILKTAGVTAEQSAQIALSTPIEVSSEEEMQQLIESGEVKDGQLYFLAEE